MLIRLFQQPAAGDELSVVVWIRELLEVAAGDYRRLCACCDRDSGKAVLAVRDIDVLAHEVQEIRSLYEQLRHPGIIVACCGDVTVRAALCLTSANSMWNVGTESLPAETGRRHSLLCLVDPVAIRILRTDYYGACRAHRRDFVACHRAINTEHVHIIAQHLKVICGPVACSHSFVMQHRHLLVRTHGEVAAETRGRPGRVAALAGHALVAMRELLHVIGMSPRHTVDL